MYSDLFVVRSYGMHAVPGNYDNRYPPRGGGDSVSVSVCLSVSLLVCACVCVCHLLVCSSLQWDTGRGQYSGGQSTTPQGGNVGGGGYSTNQAALTGQYTDTQLAQYAASGQMQYQGGGQQGLYGTGSSPQVLKVAYNIS